MKKKIVKFNYKGVDYEVIPFNSCFSCCMEVDIREVVRPDKKWFRTKSVDNRTFFQKYQMFIMMGLMMIMQTMTTPQMGQQQGAQEADPDQ